MYYLISGWDDKGNQLVEYHFGNTQEEAEQAFLESIGGGEVNEILDAISNQDYEEAIRESERKENDIMNTNIIEATNNTMTNKENATMKIDSRSKAIKCIETGNTYISIVEAAREMNIHHVNIRKVLRGAIAHAKGYHFEYLSEEETHELFNSMEPKEIIIQKPARIRGKGKSCNGNTNAVLCISTGDVYTSCTDAAMNADSTVGHMSHVCRGNGSTVKGKRYCYVKDINEHLDEVATSIRKANMYDEFMTKEEKRKELVGRIEYYDNMIEYNNQTVNRLLQEKQELQESRERAIKELMCFGF
jgi:hypothetical protein